MTLFFVSGFQLRKKRGTGVNTRKLGVLRALVTSMTNRDATRHLTIQTTNKLTLYPTRYVTPNRGATRNKLRVPLRANSLANGRGVKITTRHVVHARRPKQIGGKVTIRRTMTRGLHLLRSKSRARRLPLLQGLRINLGTRRIGRNTTNILPARLRANPEAISNDQIGRSGQLRKTRP